jgi:hypothetical protein
MATIATTATIAAATTIFVLFVHDRGLHCDVGLVAFSLEGGAIPPIVVVRSALWSTTELMLQILLMKCMLVSFHEY